MDIKSKLEILDEKSDVVKDLIGKTPHWILRWGLGFGFVFILMLIIFSWIIKFPDIITAPISITSIHPPIKLIAQTDGPIVLFVKNRQIVNKGEALATIETTASYKDIQSLKDLLNTYSNTLDKPAKIKETAFNEMLRLGEIQELYASLVKTHNEYRHYLLQNISEKEILFAKEKIKAYNKLKEQQERVNELMERDYKLTSKNYERFDFLEKKKMVSAKELEDVERTMVNSGTLREESKLEALNTEVNIVELNSKIKELALNDLNQKQLFIYNLNEHIKRLNAKISEWEFLYVIKSPASGTVTLLDVWNNNQFVKKGSEILIVTSRERSQLIGKAHVPISNSGRIRPGQRVNVRLEGYPYYQYGLITAKVESISPIPNSEDVYIADITFPNGLMTSYNKEIRFSPSLNGTAEIITEDLRLIERLFYSLRRTIYEAGKKKE